MLMNSNFGSPKTPDRRLEMIFMSAELLTSFLVFQICIKGSRFTMVNFDVGLPQYNTSGNAGNHQRHILQMHESFIPIITKKHTTK